MSKTDTKTLYASKEVDYHSPKDIVEFIMHFEGITEFDVDPCTEMKNIPAKLQITPEMDGLKTEWPKGYVWLNPPYGRDFSKWIKKAEKFALDGKGVVWGILPANRINNKYYMDNIFSSICAGVIFLLQGKIKFGLHGNFEDTASFPVMLVRWASYDNEYKYIVRENFIDSCPFKGALIKSVCI